MIAPALAHLTTSELGFFSFSQSATTTEIVSNIPYTFVVDRCFIAVQVKYKIENAEVVR